jgi:predicted DNA-binding transcriptional regulator AlpA
MQKHNRKTAPPGFLTAKEAMTTIGVPSTTFYTLVKEGVIPGVVLPGRKEAVYPVGKIEQYRRSLKAAMDLYMDEQSYDFSLALKEDIPEIRALVASESGGYEHTVPQAVMEAWIRKNPEALHILRKGSEIVGYVSMFPLPLETIMKRLSGEYWNRTIPLDDIQPFLPKTPYPLYVAEMVAKKDEQHHNPKHIGMRLVVEMAKLLVEWAKEGIIFHHIYAVGTSEEGISMCRSLGMQPVELPEGTRKNRIPFSLDIRYNTKSLLVADYSKFVK